MNKHIVKQKNRWIKLAFLILIWLLIWSLVKDFSRVSQGYGRIKEARVRLATVQKENRDMIGRMEAIGEEYFIERMMREKLNLQRPGEIIVVLPERVIEITKESDLDSQSEKQNWEKWRELIGW